MWIFPCFWKTLVLWTPEVCIFATVSSFLLASQSTSLWIILGFQDTILFSTSLFSRFNSFFFFWSVFLSWICTALFQEIPSIRSFLPVGESFKYQSINQSSGSGRFLRVFELKSKSAGICMPVGCVPAIAYIRFGASSRKRHGNKHARPAGLRVPVRSNLRNFLVKCSTSGGFFVNFYTLFFSTTSSILLRKV